MGVFDAATAETGRGGQEFSTQITGDNPARRSDRQAD